MLVTKTLILKLLYCIFVELSTNGGVGAQNINSTTIISSPPGTAVNGSTNTFVYPIMSSVTLTCIPDPAVSVTYAWMTNGCTTCFPNGVTDQNATTSSLTPDDAGTFTCFADGGSGPATSAQFTLRVSYTPSNVAAIVLSSRSVEVMWDAFSTLSGVTGYIISYTVTASYTSGGSMAVNDVSTENYTLTNLEEYTNYIITVRATSNSGMSDDSDGILVTTYTAAPSGPPQNIAVRSLDRASLNVTWEPPLPIDQNGPITSYLVRYRVRGDSNHVTHEFAVNETEAIISGLNPYVVYYVQVGAINVNGTRTFSFLYFQFSGQDLPTAPRSLSVDNTDDNTITLSWMEPNMSNGIIITYQLEYRISNSDASFMAVNSNLLMYTVTGLMPSTGYQVRVAAFTRVGRGPYSMLVQALTTVPTPSVSLTAPSSQTFPFEPQTVGRRLTLQCEVTAVRGITNRVDIVWSSGGTELQRMNNVSAIMMNNSLVYTDLYDTLRPLRLNDTGTMFHCEVMINSNPAVMNNDNFTLNVTGPQISVASSPDGVPVNGVDNTFEYPVLNNVALTCRMRPPTDPDVNVDYSWNTTGCYTHSGYNGQSCFPSNNAAQTVTGFELTAEDAGTISCTAQIFGDEYTSKPFTLHISGIVIIVPQLGDAEIVTGNLANDYSFIYATATSGTPLIARCVTGLGPSDGDDNNALGGLYSNGTRIPNGNCNASTAIQPIGAMISNYVGVMNLHQCRALTPADEGIYICVMMNSSMMRQSMRLGVYCPGRTAPVINTALSSSAETVDVGSTLTLFCTSQNSPPDMFIWQKDNDPTVINSTRITTMELSTTSAVFCAEYVIDIVTESSNGVYTCAVINPIGRDTHDIMLTTVVPIPTVIVTALDTQTVGQSLALQCEVTTVRGITSRVDIVWSSGGMELQRMNGVSSTMMSNSLAYTNSYTISQLNTTDDGRVFECQAMINANTLVQSSDNITLDVIEASSDGGSEDDNGVTIALATLLAIAVIGLVISVMIIVFFIVNHKQSRYDVDQSDISVKYSDIKQSVSRDHTITEYANQHVKPSEPQYEAINTKPNMKPNCDVEMDANPSYRATS